MDIQVINHGSLIGLLPVSEAGESWLSENLPEDVQCLGTTRFCEPRYVANIIEGMCNDGLKVES